MGRKIFKITETLPIRGARFAFPPPRITAPRMKLNDQLNLQAMGYFPSNFPASKIFLPPFLKLAARLPGAPLRCISA